MYIAMNRFKIKPEFAEDFKEVWRTRNSYLDAVSGFKEFHLLQGETTEEFTLFASHALWESKEDFLAWTESDAFKKAHEGAGARRHMHVSHPNFEGFDVVL